MTLLREDTAPPSDAEADAEAVLEPVKVAQPPKRRGRPAGPAPVRGPPTRRSSRQRAPVSYAAASRASVPADKLGKVAKKYYEH